MADETPEDNLTALLRLAYEASKMPPLSTQQPPSAPGMKRAHGNVATVVVRPQIGMEHQHNRNQSQHFSQAEAHPQSGQPGTPLAAEGSNSATFLMPAAPPPRKRIKVLSSLTLPRCSPRTRTIETQTNNNSCENCDFLQKNNITKEQALRHLKKLEDSQNDDNVTQDSNINNNIVNDSLMNKVMACSDLNKSLIFQSLISSMKIKKHQQQHQSTTTDMVGLTGDVLVVWPYQPKKYVDVGTMVTPKDFPRAPALPPRTETQPKQQQTMAPRMTRRQQPQHTWTPQAPYTHTGLTQPMYPENITSHTRTTLDTNTNTMPPYTQTSPANMHPYIRTSYDMAPHTRTSHYMAPHTRTSHAPQNQTSQYLPTYSQTSYEMAPHTRTSNDIAPQAQTSQYLPTYSQTSHDIVPHTRTSQYLPQFTQTPHDMVTHNTHGYTQTCMYIPPYTQTSHEMIAPRRNTMEGNANQQVQQQQYPNAHCTYYHTNNPNQ